MQCLVTSLSVHDDVGPGRTEIGSRPRVLAVAAEQLDFDGRGELLILLHLGR